MKKLLILSSILFAFIFYSIQAQNVAKRVSQIGGTASKTQNGLAVDAAGNTYIGGSTYIGSLNFGNSINLNSDNYGRGYLAKYNTQGNCDWALVIGNGVDGEVYFNSIAISDDGYIYVAGYYYVSDGAIDFGNGNVTTNEGYENVCFVAKYDTDGECKWLREISNSSSSYIDTKNISVSDLGAIYVAGEFSTTGLTTINFNNGQSITGNANSTSDIFVAKYDASGDCQWAKGITGDDANDLYNISTHTDGSNDYVYVVGGYTSSTLDFGNSKNLSNNGFNRTNGFLGIFDGDNGDCTVALKIEGNNDDYSDISSITIADDKSFYIGGTFETGVKLYNADGSGYASINSIGNMSYSDSFIAKYDASGDVQWARVISNTGLSTGFANISLVYDNNRSSLYIIGHFGHQIISFNSPGKSEQKSISGSGLGGFLAKYDSEGDYEWSVLINNNEPSSGNFFTKLDFDGNGDLYVGGYFGSTSLNIGSFTLTREAEALGFGPYDGIVIKFGEGQPATLATLSAPIKTSGVTRYTAISGAEVIDDGGAEVTERGICISTSRYPNSGNGTLIPADEAGIGAYTVSIIDLWYGTKYYVRPYAINSVGVAYGTVRTFTTAPAGGVFN